MCYLYRGDVMACEPNLGGPCLVLDLFYTSKFRFSGKMTTTTRM